MGRKGKGKGRGKGNGPRVRNHYQGEYHGLESVKLREWKGCRVEEGWEVPVVPATIPPTEFFDRFVITRTPGELPSDLSSTPELIGHK
jgi:hypothetical protein